MMSWKLLLPALGALLALLLVQQRPPVSDHSAFTSFAAQRSVRRDVAAPGDDVTLEAFRPPSDPADATVAACSPPPPNPGASSPVLHPDASSCGCAVNATLEQLTQRWRAAEYTEQTGVRLERALFEALRVKSIANESSHDRMMWESPAPAAQLEAQLNATRAALTALQPELAALRAEVDAAWPPSEQTSIAAPPELPLSGGCAASRLRGGARPHATSPLPPVAFTRRYNISFLLQYFNHPANIDAIVDTLYACTTGSAYGGPVAAGVPVGTTTELVVNVDSRGDAAAWDAAVNRTAAGSFLTVLLSNNLHEVHGYNRAAAVARGDVLILLQDDILPPADCRWLTDVLARFDAFPRLGAVGLNIAETWMPPAVHEKAGGTGGSSRRVGGAGILFRHQGMPFQFVTVADYSPFAVRASALAVVGGMDEGMAAPGECGILADYDLCMRLWMAGWQVAHAALRNSFRVSGVGGTHRSPSVGAKCWGKQLHLNNRALSKRFSPADTAVVFDQLRELNSQLEAAFEGEPPWVRCCGGDKGPPHRGACDPCGTVHGGFVNVPPV